MSLWLKQLGAYVTGYSLPPPTSPSLFELASLKSDMHSIEGDVTNLSSLLKAFSDTQPEVVFHLAAQPLVRRSYHSPVETYSTNVMGTVNLLEAVRQSPSVRSVVIITTDKCYENKEWVWGYREDEPMGGHDPYSSSKGCAELVTSAYRRSFFGDQNSTQIATARAGNVFGGGDFAEDRLIPDILRAITNSTHLEIRHPESIRPWQHVLEPISGYLTLAEKMYSEPGFAEGWNFGPQESDCWPVGKILKYFEEFWPQLKVKSNNIPTSQLHEAKYLKLDISKAQRKLNWHPTIPVEHGLQMTTEWYQAFIRKANLRDLTLSQIAQFCELRNQGPL